MSKHLTMLVGPCGSGKSTLARQMAEQDPNLVYINQDAQGRDHLAKFGTAIELGLNVVCDRMNFTKQQRSRYLELAKANGYTSKIIVLHQSYEVCLQRCIARQGHETIKEESAARSALNMFFSKYERVEDSEANVVERIWPEGEKPLAIISDLDGTLCEVEHRRHFVRPPENILVGPNGEMVSVLGQLEVVEFDTPLPRFKKDWNGFFKAMVNDTVNESVMTLLWNMVGFSIIYCSGRPDNYRKETEQWLVKNDAPDGPVYMRLRNDSRQDDIVKEMLLDFEILTRVTPFFILDDRDQVVAMWRRRGYSCFQVAPGDF